MFLGFLDPDPYPLVRSMDPESGSFYQAKLVSISLIPTVLWLLFDFLSLKNDVNVPSKSNEQKNFLLLFFCWPVTKIAGSGSEYGFISQRHGSAEPDLDPDLHQYGMDPQHCPNMSPLNSEQSLTSVECRPTMQRNKEFTNFFKKLLLYLWEYVMPDKKAATSVHCKPYFCYADRQGLAGWQMGLTDLLGQIIERVVAGDHCLDYPPIYSVYRPSWALPLPFKHSHLKPSSMPLHPYSFLLL